MTSVLGNIVVFLFFLSLLGMFELEAKEEEKEERKTEKKG